MRTTITVAVDGDCDDLSGEEDVPASSLAAPCHSFIATILSVEASGPRRNTLVTKAIMEA